MKNYILDTHALIWFCEGNKKLSKKAKIKIENKNNCLYVSFASLWEIVIKFTLGRLKSAINIDSILQFIVENEISILNFETKHLKILESLPFHHDDPFDRFIIAQAISVNYPIISVDSKFVLYEVKVVW